MLRTLDDSPTYDESTGARAWPAFACPSAAAARTRAAAWTPWMPRQRCWLRYGEAHCKAHISAPAPGRCTWTALPAGWAALVAAWTVRGCQTLHASCEVATTPPGRVGAASSGEFPTTPPGRVGAASSCEVATTPTGRVEAASSCEAATTLPGRAGAASC
eukprot:363888-Chlamydomonas_euryale.AAC.16